VRGARRQVGKIADRRRDNVEPRGKSLVHKGWSWQEGLGFGKRGAA
jgi:hypothetical protein